MGKECSMQNAAGAVVAVNCVCARVCQSHSTAKKGMQGERDGEEDNEREAKRERGRTQHESVGLCPRDTHTVTEPSTFCICCAGGRGSFTHTSTHIHTILYLSFPPAISV